MPIEQVNVTNNQSTLTIQFDQVFLFNNKYDERTLNNTTASGDITTKIGSLLFKNAATTVDILTDVDANIDKVVGILALVNDTVILDTESLDINMATQGEINENAIVLPGAMTFDDVIPTTTITLRDHLNSLGFHLTKSIENTKFDNV